MKLKKVLSLVLGGVMALSMLTACGGSSEENEAIAEVVASSSGLNTSVVQAIIDYISGNTDAFSAAMIENDFSGNESKDLKTIVDLLESAGFDADNYAESLDEKTVMLIDAKTVEDSNTELPGSKTTYVFAVKKSSSVTDKFLGTSIAKWLENLGTEKQNISTITVYDSSLPDGKYDSGNVGDTDLTNLSDYWVIAVTTE